jgi:hypothetical protein
VARKPQDQAVDDLLLDHEAERQALELRLRVESTATLQGAAKQAAEMLRRPKPSAALQAKAVDLLVRAVLLSLAGGAEATQAMVRRQAKEREKAFAGRSGEKLEIEPITRARIEARQKFLAEAKASG